MKAERPKNTWNKYKGVGLLAVASLLWLFGPKVPLDHYFTKTQKIVEATESVQSSATREVADDFKDLTAPAPPFLDNSALRSVRECLPEYSSQLSEGSSLQSAAEILLTLPGTTSNIEKENIHIRTSDGRELRMMIAPSEVDSTKLEAQLFSVDKEGLPIIEQWPLHLNRFDIEKARSYFLSQGNVILTEATHLIENSEANLSGTLVYSQDQLVTAEISNSGRFLGCSQSISTRTVACQCM